MKLAAIAVVALTVPIVRQKLTEVFTEEHGRPPTDDELLKFLLDEVPQPTDGSDPEDVKALAAVEEVFEAVYQKGRTDLAAELAALPGRVPGADEPDWPEDLKTFEERKAFQRGVAVGVCVKTMAVSLSGQDLVVVPPAG